MSNDNRIESVRKLLRAKAREGQGEIPVRGEDLLLLLDEVGRLLQSSDRLRRQNRRLRLRCQRAGLVEPGDDANDDAGAATGESGHESDGGNVS